ncbi:MAG TPA: hypothetical protein VN604_05755, partial [Nitrospirota bacterium]|nr:hypothetical protein [Nitrospirota bacterium]
IREEISPPYLYGDSMPEIVIAGWGSTYGLMREAVDELARSYRIAMLHFSELFPFPLSSPSPRRGEPATSSVETGGVRGGFDYLGLLSNAELTVCIEQNATGQFERLLRAETGFESGAYVRKFDGRPFLQEELVRELQEKIRKL